MSDCVVHSIPGSPYGRAVLVALEEKGVRYRFAPVAFGAQRAAAHLARHPFGRVPVLEHGDFGVYETQAILRYVDRAFAGPPLTPAGPRATARMDQLMNVNDWYLFQGVGNVIGFQRIVGPRAMGLVPDEQAVAAALPKAERVFAVLAQELAERAFFTGDALSLADILLAPLIDFLSMTPEWAPLSAGRRNLVDWLARMNARPSMAATTWERIEDLARAG